MYSIYADDVCVYNDKYTFDKVRALTPKLILEDNTAGSLSFSLPVESAGYDTITRLATDIVVEKDGKEIWDGRVLSESKDFYNSRTFYCEGALAYFNDTSQPPGEHSGLSVRAYLEELVDVHNSKVSPNRQFTVGIVTVADDTFPTYYTNNEKSMDLINALVERYGGHLRVRKENGVRYLDYLADYPNTCSQIIQFGSNLIDFTKNWDSTDYATVILPLGERLDDSPIEALDAYLTIEDVNGGSMYLQSADAVAEYGWIEKTVTWDDVSDPDTLLSKAREYLNDLQFDNMKLELTALDLHYLNAGIDTVELLDEIRVVSRPHGLDRMFPVTKLEIPLDKPEQTQFTLGDTVETSLTGVTNQSNSDILKAIDEFPKAHSLLKEAKANATEIMNMATTGYITITHDEYGSDTLYITNTRDYTAADKMWKWNMNGLGYSKDGGKTFGLAITMDGSIVADYITSGILNADVIRTGVIRDRASNVVLDLDSGALTMKKGSIDIGKGNFTVDEEGNLYARRGTFAGTLAGVKGTFGGVVQATDFLDSSGRSMMDGGRFKAKYLDLYGIKVTDATGTTTFEIDSFGAITINGKIKMGAGSTIDWSSVANNNLSDSSLYEMVSDAAARADAAYNLAKANKLPGNITATRITETTIESSVIMGSSIYWGDSGAHGGLLRTTGSDGVNLTDLVQMYSDKGIVLEAKTGMRFEADSLWINLDASAIHFRHGGAWVSFSQLI